jgi:hypothetical protein
MSVCEREGVREREGDLKAPTSEETPRPAVESIRRKVFAPI